LYIINSVGIAYHQADKMHTSCDEIQQRLAVVDDIHADA